MSHYNFAFLDEQSKRMNRRAILKAVWEGWGTLARLFGWTSLQERAELSQASGAPSRPSRPVRRSRLRD